jgi:hypothetical protein
MRSFPEERFDAGADVTPAPLTRPRRAGSRETPTHVVVAQPLEHVDELVDLAVPDDQRVDVRLQ